MDELQHTIFQINSPHVQADRETSLCLNAPTILLQFCILPNLVCSDHAMKVQQRAVSKVRVVSVSPNFDVVNFLWFCFAFPSFSQKLCFPYSE